jgi:tRNA A-37 threonylcarbamoyl transferase component Bud32
MTANRSQRIIEGDPIHSTLRTIEAMGLGTSIGLSRDAMLTLGLASILDQVTANQGEEEAIKYVSTLHSLGDLSPHVMFTLWDLELIRAGGRAGKLAQILEVADQYVRLTHRQVQRRNAEEFWGQLARTTPSARSIINFYRHWKGSLPIGSIVRHPDIGQALVLDYTGPDNTMRLVPFSEWGELSDITEDREVEIDLSYLGPIHGLFIPSQADASRPSRGSGEPPFPLPEGYFRTELNVGDTFGGRKSDRFEIIGVAGQGAQAIVYKAHDTRLDRTIAVKLSSTPDANYRSKMLIRFERELKLSSKISHPHVVAIHDCGELEGGTPYVLLEWMEHGDLGRILESAWSAGQLLPVAHIHYYALAIASAMKAIHGVGIVHRDIKPDNILLRGDGVAKLTDFGIAKDLNDQQQRLTEMGQTLGTLGYMAPEQLLGMPGPQSDVFSFGVVLFQMLTSSLPAQTDRNGRPSGHIIETEWDLIPAHWAALIQPMVLPDLDTRMASFEAVLQALLDFAPGDDLGRSTLATRLLPHLPTSASVSATGGLGNTGDFQTDLSTDRDNDTIFIDTN